MPKALANQIKRQFADGAGIMQVEHTDDCFGGASVGAGAPGETG